MPGVKANAKEASACFPELTNHQIDSSIQDYFGGEILAEYRESLKTKDDNLDGEDQYRTRFVKPLAAIIDFNCRYGEQAKEINKNIHGSPEARFKIIFSNPKLRASLGCKESTPSSAVSCQFNNNKNTSTAPESTYVPHEILRELQGSGAHHAN